MRSLPAQPLAEKVTFSASTVTVYLKNARSLTVPLAWFESLSNASKEERLNYEILGDGEGIHWPGLDEDVSVMGLLLGLAGRAA